MIAEFLVQRLDDVETAGEGIYFNVAEATGVGILLTLNFLGPIAILSPSITASKLGMSREDASRRLAELIKKGHVWKFEKGKYSISQTGVEFFTRLCTFK